MFSTVRKLKATFVIFVLLSFSPCMHMQLHDVSMIQDMDRDKRNLIVYDMVTGTKFLLRASKPSVRNTWLDRSNLLIEEAKQLVSTERSRSSSEPPELAGLRKSHRGKEKEREGPKRKLKRPSSSTGTRESSSTTSPTSPPAQDTSNKKTKMVSGFIVVENYSPGITSCVQS